MGEARRRKLIEAQRRIDNTRHSEPWLCPHCQNTVSFAVWRGTATCPDCAYSTPRRGMGFSIALASETCRPPAG